MTSILERLLNRIKIYTYLIKTDKIIFIYKYINIIFNSLRSRFDVYLFFHPNTYSQIGFSLKLFSSNKLNIFLIFSSLNNLSSCLITSFYFLLLSLKVWQFVTVWFGGLYVYFSVYICNVFNLTIIVLCGCKNFSFCVFWGSSGIYGGVLSRCKVYPSIWVLLCWLLDLCC